ncbi:FtsB family cell division protein [Roseivirga sp.]|uniref:FtsB family cell division protein n=1 Tax=Roseivirga sp. TaxID=1964215 RepID=UPI003B8BF991
MKNPFTKIPKVLKNYYFLFGLFFLTWMFLIDSNDIVTQVRMTKKLNSLKAQKEFYVDKKIQVQKDKEELSTDKKLLEKFAREKYLMKKPSEDLYVVVSED